MTPPCSLLFSPGPRPASEELGLIEAKGKDRRARSYRLTANGSTYLIGTTVAGE
jgi:hypothetical protein